MNKLTKHKYSRKVVVFAFLATILLTSFLTFQVAETIFSGTVDTVPIYLEPFHPYSYLIETNSTHYFAKNGTTGQLEIISTNASYVFETVLVNNASIYVSRGDFAIDYHVICTAENLILQGAGMDSTNLCFGANGRITFSKAGYMVFRENIAVRDLTLDGQYVAQYGLGSDSSSGGGTGNLILRGFEVFMVRTRNFNASETSCSFSFANLEEAWIHQCILGSSPTGIYLWQEGNYQSGNIRITDSWINTVCSGYNETRGILVNSTGDDFDSDVGNVFVERNHFLGGSNASVAVEVHTDHATLGRNTTRVNVQHNRMENCDIFHSYSKSTATSRYHIIADNELAMAGYSWSRAISFDQFTRNCDVHDNIISSSSSSAYFFVDEGSIYNNAESKFHDNYLVSVAQVDFALRSIVYDNVGLDSYYVVKTAGVDPLRGAANSVVSNFGTSVSSLSTGVKYLVLSSDVYLTVSGELADTIEIYDASDTLIASLGTSCQGYRVAWEQQFEITWSGDDPTIQLLWVK